MTKSFKFIDHTADIAVELFGSSLEDLFSAGAEAWLASIAEDDKLVADDLLDVELSAVSNEELLVTFLNELNYLLLSKKWICLSIESIKILQNSQGCELSAELSGTLFSDSVKLKQEIKSVTYHQVEIIKRGDEYFTRIVFDI